MAAPVSLPDSYRELVARFNIVLVYEPDPTWYITQETDGAKVLTRHWYRIWHRRLVARETTTLDPDELRRSIEAEGLDPAGWRLPTEEEKRPGG